MYTLFNQFPPWCANFSSVSCTDTYFRPLHLKVGSYYSPPPYIQVENDAKLRRMHLFRRHAIPHRITLNYPVIEHGEDNESGIRTCLRQRWSHAACPTTPGKPPRQTVPSGVVPATPAYETTKRRGATPWGIRERDGRLSSLHQTLTHFYVMSAADSAHHGSACIATTEHMPTQTLTEVEIRRTDGSLHTYSKSTWCSRKKKHRQIKYGFSNL